MQFLMSLLLLLESAVAKGNKLPALRFERRVVLCADREQALQINHVLWRQVSLMMLEWSIPVVFLSRSAVTTIRSER